jgi:HPt (histidine-containing phosphotransfer) domain-containing protein
MISELERLKREYAAGLPEKAAALATEARGVVKRLERGQAPAHGKVEKLAHKLAGSSGTYGFMVVSALARLLEDAIAGGEFDKRAPEDAAGWLKLWLDAFEAHAARAARQEPDADVDDVLRPLGTRRAA